MSSAILFWLSIGLAQLSQANYDYPKGKPVYINPITLANCILIAADKYPNSKLKTPDYLKGKSFKNRKCSVNEEAWMLYLQAAGSRSCDFETGHEEKLKSWVLQQPDNTIDPLSIFEKSLEFNDGNLTDSLLTVRSKMRFFGNMNYLGNTKA